jgi:GNAT superfamily N-acetyltransferase
MIIRRIEAEDTEAFLSMLKQLDSETKNMMYEPGERKTSVDEMKSNILNTTTSNSLLLVAQDNGRIVGFLSAERGFAKRIKHSAYVMVGVLKDYQGKGIGTKLFQELISWAKVTT